jgi:hypothetical protein
VGGFWKQPVFFGRKFTGKLAGIQQQSAILFTVK